MKDKDKILKEMQIQIYTYEQINNGEIPILVISGRFYESLWFESISLHNVKMSHDGKYTLLGSEFKVSYSLAFDEFIVGKRFKVGSKSNGRNYNVKADDNDAVWSGC